MRERIKNLKSEYIYHIENNKFISSFIVGFCLLLIALGSNYFAAIYATLRASSSVTDIILDNIPTFDVDFLYVWGAYAMVLYLAISLIMSPKHILFALKAIALFVIIRATFTTLTHIGQPFNQILNDPLQIGRSFFFYGDLFFSSHTGLPFLMALIFWKDLMQRRIFITISILLAVVVLLGHYHYSIDVFAAYFITYSIYKMATILFKKDFSYF